MGLKGFWAEEEWLKEWALLEIIDTKSLARSKWNDMTDGFILQKDGDILLVDKIFTIAQCMKMAGRGKVSFKSAI